ncbi:MAG: LysE family translocator [Oceanospirillaceae bacterium]|nr:LysE family translocator [Oceanospirillaceae bacterium]
MVEILAYAFGIMYTPGPVNLMSLNAGLSGQVRPTLRFCLGVGCAMLILLLIFGYSGAWLINTSTQLTISTAGSMYIAYLAYKIAGSALKSVLISNTKTHDLSFKSGLVMQLLNPKSFVVILPIVTVQFPAVQISGSAIFTWSLLLTVMACGAPCSYLLIGNRLGALIKKPIYLRYFNLCMAALLVYVAIDIAYQHVYLKW